MIRSQSGPTTIYKVRSAAQFHSYRHIIHSEDHSHHILDRILSAICLHAIVCTASLHVLLHNPDKHADIVRTNSIITLYFLNIHTRTAVIMCDFEKNYYVYSNCREPALHFVRYTIDGNAAARCKASPHERYVMVTGNCHQCG